MKESRMTAYVEAIKLAMILWESIVVKLIDIPSNEEADALARISVTPCPSKDRWIQVKIMTSSVPNSASLVIISLDS